MNVEKTIEFILGQQAKTEAHLAELSANQVKTDAQIAELSTQIAEVSAQQKKTDRQIATVAVLVQAGMKRLIQQEKKLDRLIKALTGQKTNGHRR
jgi:septal ring factor EnvC (AmiA/AmiB activator)